MRQRASKALQGGARILDSLAARLGQVEADVEIERKYLLRSLPPEVHGHPSSELTQGYVPGGEFRERVRRVVGADTTHFLRTLKAGRGLRRIELEEEIDEALFDGLFAVTEGARVHKRRYRVPDGLLFWEVDDFLDRSLVLAEVELPREMHVPLPRWLAPHVVREVTEEREFVNQVLAR